MVSVLCKLSGVSLLFATLLLDYVTSLELTELEVPTQVLMGARVVMLCRWALGPNDVLYSVKWYKDGKEFFRYVPKDLEPCRKFLLPGVHVEKSSSFGSNLTLAPTALATSGRYRCEVSGERPRFQTVSNYTDLQVVALPSLAPKIVGLKAIYRVGDHLNASCVSGQTKPSVKLTWYINGEPAPAGDVNHTDGDNTTSRSSVEFSIGERFIGDLKLVCLARIASIYWRSVEKYATVSVHSVRTSEDDKNMPVVSIAAAYPDIGSKGSKGVPDYPFSYYCIYQLSFFTIFNCVNKLMHL